MSNELKHDLANARGFSLIVFLLMFNVVLAVSALVRVIRAAWNC